MLHTSRLSLWVIVAVGFGIACCRSQPQSPDASGVRGSAQAAPSACSTAVPPRPSQPLPGASGSPGPGTAAAANCGNAPGQLFPPAAPWNTRVNTAPVDARSPEVIGYLAQQHTGRARFQLDFSLTMLTADASTPRQPFTPTVDFYRPDCDPAPVPVPPGGSLEDETGYACANNGDCHLIVLDRSQCRLWEMWRADIRDGAFRGGCLAVWDLARVYPPSGRGDQCTSADAAGFPIAPLLFTADEIAAGEIRHAIRFILPNKLIRRNVLVRPATHSTKATRGPGEAPPYGARFRLKSGTDLNALKPAARVVARALQDHGMLLADGGSITFTAMSDAHTAHKWTEVGLGPHDLKALAWNDFELIDAGPPMAYSGSCQRTPVAK
jgi:hypothetical protein